MAFLLSPGVQVRETDLTNIIPAVATSIGGYVSPFAWGPTNTVTTVSSEAELIEKFGKPVANYNVREWYSAANFLGYTNNLKVVRVSNGASRSLLSILGNSVTAKYEGAIGDTLGIAIASSDVNLTETNTSTIENSFIYTTSFSVGPVTTDTSDPSNTLSVTDFSEIVGTNDTSGDPATSFTVLGITFTVTATTPDSVTAEDFANAFTTAYEAANGASTTTTNTDFSVSITLPNTSTAIKSALFSTNGLLFTGKTANAALNTSVSATSTLGYLYGTEGSYTLYKDVLTSAPSANEVSVVVYDFSGEFTGTAGSVLETYEFISDVVGAKTLDGAPNYVADVLGSNGSSRYVEVSAWNNTTSSSFARIGYTASGSNGEALTDGDITSGWDLFSDAERFDVNILVAGPVSVTVQKYIIDSIASVRKDCIAVVAPTEAASASASLIVAHFITFSSSSYGVFTSAWKRQYDRYNDAYITVPCDADVAGLMARTDRTNDAWWSPAGLNRGQINNVVSLTFNPSAADRDTLYKNRVNPIVTLPGQGTVLYGDKTGLSRPSAFDRINVRRLFIILEKAIATAAKFQLFEFNDDFTRSNFVAAVEPYLRDIRARRGITDFFVKCDAENNTSAVVDRNEFVADIYVKPARSINFIRLNFVAVRSGVNFSEVVGR